MRPLRYTPRMPRPASLIPLALALLGVLSLLAPLGGCAGTLTIPEQRPSDYALVLTVYPAENDEGESAGDAQPFHPARYALEPDGLLRAEVGSGVAEPSFPPIARRLEPSQIETLYGHTRLLDLDQPDSFAVPVPGPQVYQPPAGRPVALIEIASSGLARAFEIDTTDSAALPLIRELERLTWQHRD